MRINPFIFFLIYQIKLDATKILYPSLCPQEKKTMFQLVRSLKMYFSEMVFVLKLYALQSIMNKRNIDFYTSINKKKIKDGDFYCS